ncbi:MAG: Rrf2 family transcriptional regulator [Actinomycetota bacterium]|jgi:Rrf2 family protein|nr:Rrf2 family transcriptional regulator [Actinomycetota bacterium]MCL6092286.1 Rrf2 family transcriptional regulator [Actinomycetota bacterium]MDA8166641.1 Rrf2 family transcriptional regulator [Actinomycetota bacterium]
MNISAKSKYAVRALVELAQQNNGHPVPIGDIAAKRDIPLQFLEQLFSSLRKAGILNSHRGVRGGFSFKKLPEDVSVLDVVEILDGDVAPAACTIGASCDKSSRCAVRDVWVEAKSSLEGVLAAANIADLADREIMMRDEVKEMYYI